MKKLSLLALTALLLAACGTEESTEPETPVEETAQSEETSGSESGTEEVEETEATEEEAEETESESEFGKRSNPVPVGQTKSIYIELYDNDYNEFDATAEITVNSVERGQSVLEFVQGINEFNETPPEGYEYMMLDITASLVESETEDYAWFMDGMWFDFIGSDGSPYEWTSVVVEPNLSGEIYAGGTIEGKVVNMVKVDDPILLVFEDGNWDNVFFATE